MQVQKLPSGIENPNCETKVPEQSVLREEAVQAFRQRLRGWLLRPGDSGYDEARTVWNSMVDKRPLLIARCAGAADITTAVKFARTHDLIVSVRGGGHNVSGNAVCDGGLMIDLSDMKGIHVDPVRRVARVEPGTKWSDVDHETQAFGLATPGGTVSHTGVAGLTLGGGLGWLNGIHGLTCDNLLSADVVTADGECLRASATERPDLFWALRGGGGNFGIVTSFEFQLHPVGPQILGGMILYPMDQAREVLRFYRAYDQEAPDELIAYAFLITTPEGVPAVAIATCWFGETAEGELYLNQLRAFGKPMADLTGVIPYCQIQSLLDDAAPFGIHRYWKSGYFRTLDDEFLEIVLEHTARKTSPFSAVLFFRMKGAGTRVPRDATAFWHREQQWDFDILAQWTGPDEAERHIAWTRAFWQAAEPFSQGVYVNHLDADDAAGRVKAAYGGNYARLLEVKRKYDPANFFRLNKNIAP